MLSTKPNAIVVVAVVTLAAFVEGCPGSLQDPWRFSADAAGAACPDVTQTVFLPVCATAGCHSAASKTSSLDLESPGVASRLVGVATKGGAGFLIDPTLPPASVLYTKLTQSPPFGARMPFNTAPLDDFTAACVLQWVTDQVDGGLAGDSSAPADASMADDGPAEGSSSGDEGQSPIVDAQSPADVQGVRSKDASAPDARAPADAKAD